MRRRTTFQAWPKGRSVQQGVLYVHALGVRAAERRLPALLAEHRPEWAGLELWVADVHSHAGWTFADGKLRRLS